MDVEVKDVGLEVDLGLAYTCESCNTGYIEWKFYCQECESWNQIVQRKGAEVKKVGRVESSAVSGYFGDSPSGVLKLSDLPQRSVDRIGLGIAELDKLVGGGIVPGSVTILAGSPGSFKSTLALQILDHVAQQDRCLYVSGEESPESLSARAARLNCSADKLALSFGSDVHGIVSDAAKLQPSLIVVDSLQAIHDSSVSGSMGGRLQTEACISNLYAFAHQNGVAMIIICQSTKQDTFAGPRVIEHMADALFFMKRADYSDKIVEIQARKNRNGGSLSSLDLEIEEGSGRLFCM